MCRCGHPAMPPEAARARSPDCLSELCCRCRSPLCYRCKGISQAPPLHNRMPQVMSALDTFMQRVRWSPLDVLVIDMPPGTGECDPSVACGPVADGAIGSTWPLAMRLAPVWYFCPNPALHLPCSPLPCRRRAAEHQPAAEPVWGSHREHAAGKAQAERQGAQRLSRLLVCTCRS